MALDEPLLNPGSQLCVACGLCCEGALHDLAVLRPDEIPLAFSLGMTVTETDGQVDFQLPCHLLKNGCCTVYSRRPSPCSGYRCQLLKSLEVGAIDLEEGLDKVRNAHALVRIVRDLLPQEMTLPEARTLARAASKESAPAANEAKLTMGKIKLQVTALILYLDKHFRNKREGKLLSFEKINEKQDDLEHQLD